MMRVLAIAGLILCACDGAEAGEGTLRVTAWGEGFIEEGIPADAFVDGWSVTFDTFLGSLSEIDAEEAGLEGTHVLDLSKSSAGAGQELGPLTVAAGRRPILSWSLAPATSDAVTDIDDKVLDAMVGANASIWARGTARRGDEVKTFDWALDTRSRYVECDTGVSLAAGETQDAVLTVHADHLFYDDLDAEDPGVAFDLIAAADMDLDGAITLDELRAQSLSGQTRYQVGGRDIDDLHGFIVEKARTVGHINGEGHCEIE